MHVDRVGTGWLHTVAIDRTYIQTYIMLDSLDWMADYRRYPVVFSAPSLLSFEESLKFRHMAAMFVEFPLLPTHDAATSIGSRSSSYAL